MWTVLRTEVASVKEASNKGLKKSTETHYQNEFK